MMPKSTATEACRRHRRTDCRDACRRGRSRRAARGAGRLWITLRPSAGQVEPWASRRRAVVQRRCRRSTPASARRARGAVPVHRRHAEVGIVAGVLRHLGERGRFEPQIHLHRRPVRDSVSTTSIKPQAPRLGGMRSRHCARRRRRRRGRCAKRRSTPGRSTFTATGCRSPSRVDLAAVHLRDRRGGDRAGPKVRRTACAQRLVQRLRR